MDNNYLKQIQEYLNSNNVQNDSNENISLNKNQLLECFQMLLNSKDQKNNDNNNSSPIKEETTSKANTNHSDESQNKKNNQISKSSVKNFDDMPLPALKNRDTKIIIKYHLIIILTICQ